MKARAFLFGTLSTFHSSWDLCCGLNHQSFDYKADALATAPHRCHTYLIGSIWFYNKNHKPHYWTLRTWKQEPFFLEHLALSIRAESVRLDVVRSSSINHFLNVYLRDNWSNQLKDVRVILCILKVLFQLCTKSRIGWFTSKMEQGRELSTNCCTTSFDAIRLIYL